MNAAREAEITRALREFHERIGALDETYDQLHGLVGIDPEAPLANAIWAVAGGWQRALDTAYGLGGWLEWWWLECALGAKPKSVRLPGEEERTIATVDDLVAVVLDDLRHCETSSAAGSGGKD